MRLFWRRWLFLVLGGALFTPYAILVMVVLPLAVPSLARVHSVAFLLLGLVVVLLGLAAMAGLPAVRTLEAAVVPSLLGGRVADLTVPAPASRGDRVRTGTFFVLHVLSGAVVSLATVVGVPVAAGLLVGAVLGDPSIPLGAGSTPMARGWAAPLGLAMLVAVVGLVLLCATALTAAAPRLLGPSAAARLAALERRTTELAERSRLARELHDSIGHALTVTTLQASAARTVLRRDPEFAEEALLAIEQTGRAAAADLDDFLGLLREERAPRAPQPTLRDLAALVSSHPESGLPLEHRVEGELSTVPAVVSREVYRIAQEALTNVHRHAGSAPTTLQVRVSGDAVVVEVHNQAPDRVDPGRFRAVGAARADRGGRGLTGIRERVRQLDGTVQVGPDGNEGWALRAVVPTGSRR